MLVYKFSFRIGRTQHTMVGAIEVSGIRWRVFVCVFVLGIRLNPEPGQMVGLSTEPWTISLVDKRRMLYFCLKRSKKGGGRWLRD